MITQLTVDVEHPDNLRPEDVMICLSAILGYGQGRIRTILPPVSPPVDADVFANLLLVKCSLSRDNFKE